MARTLSISQLQSLLDSECKSDEMMEKVPKTDSDSLVTEIFKEMDAKTLEDLSDKEEEIMSNILAIVRCFAKFTDAQKNNLARQIYTEAAMHTENLQELLQEELHEEKARKLLGESFYEKRLNETIGIMNSKMRKITDEGNKSSYDYLNFLSSDVKELIKTAVKRKEEEIKETNAIASVYSSTVGYLSQLFSLLCVTIFVLWIYTAVNLF